MKKILALFLTLSMLFALTACRGNDENTSTDEGTGATTSTTESTNNATDGTEGETQGTTEGTTDSDATDATQQPTTTPSATTPPVSTPPTTSPTTPPSSSTTPPTTTPPTTPPTTPATPGTQECQHANLKWDIPFDKTKPLPTCTESGYYGYWCDDCNIRFDNPVAALGHTGGTATCSSLAKCTRCRQGYGELDTNNHVRISNIIRNAVPATCEKDGYEGDLSYCNDCGKTLTKGKTLKATGHSISTYCAYGENRLTETCNNCDYTNYKDLAPINVSFKKIGNGVTFYISGGYGGAGGKYTASCSQSYDRGTQTFSKEYTNIKDEFGFYCVPVSVNDTFTITVSDYYGHSQTKKFICVQDPSNPDKLILQER